ncbi:MAG: hypothetical protein ABSB70_16840 [Candidatus Velthaea sp.]
MLIVLAPLVAVLAASDPMPAPSAPPPSPLKEIGHVQSLSVCSSIVVHANSAIAVALDNDRALALTINRLRTTDLDVDNAITRRNGMTDLETLASQIRTSAAAGSAEIKRLRTMAGQTADQNRKTELRAFTDALSGAIARQRKAGTDLARMLAIIDGRRAVEEIDTPDWVAARAAVAEPERGETLDREAAVIRNPAAPTTPSLANPILRDAADDFAQRAQTIFADEGVAADHSLGATTGC